MGRPKGSVNKKKIIKPAIAKKIEEGNPIQPTEIKTTQNTCLGCGHDKETHYGSALLNCNISGCKCRELQINQANA